MDKRLALFVPVSCGIGFFLGFELGGYQLILLEVANSFALNNVMMGVVVASQFSAITLGPLLFGWAADRYGKKIILQIFMLVFVIGCFGATFSGAVWVFASFLFITGIGYSVCECISSSALSDSFPGKESKYLNIMQCAFCFGAVLSPQVFSRLIAAELVTWRAVFILAGTGFIFVYPLLCLSRCKQQDPPRQDMGSLPPQARESFRIFTPLLLILLVAMLAYVSIEIGVSFFANVIYVTEYSNNELGSYAISGFWLSMTISRFIYSQLKIKMRTMIMMGFFLSCILLIFLVVFKNPWILMGIFILLGAVLGPVWPMIIGMGTSSFRERSGTVASILAASGGFGGSIIPVLIGWISGWGGFYGGFWLLAAISALGFLVMWFAKNIQPGPHTPE